MSGVVDCLVVGSGPGSAVTAFHLVQAGRGVVMLEEGRDARPAPPRAYSQKEIIQSYRSAGISPALGRQRINYAEGSCLGGGSEVNSGLYHRVPGDVLEVWRRDFQVAELGDGALDEHHSWIEEEVGVSYLEGPASKASQRLDAGARALGWASQEVPRFQTYRSGETYAGGLKNSMSRTLLPRFVELGGDLRCPARVERLRRIGRTWSVRVRTAGGTEELRAHHVFMGAGAVSTPFLLRRSGIRRHIGDSLRLHPMLKVVARFGEVVNEPGMGVGVHQVREFSPQQSFGCSISSLPFLGIGLIDYPDELGALRADWPYLAQYYAQVCGDSYGTVRALPFVGSPLVRYHLSDHDAHAMAVSLGRLARLLLEAGATAIYPNLRQQGPLCSEADIAALPDRLLAHRTELVAVHLVGSCPMGENTKRCAADSFGRVWGPDELFLVDGSALCTAPSVNPQGTIMAVARRNVLRFLES